MTRTSDTEIRSDGSFRLHHLWQTAGVNGGRAAGNEIWRAGTWRYAQGMLLLDFDLSQDRSEWPRPDDSPFCEAQWRIPATLGRDNSGRPALISEGEILCVKHQ